MAATPPPAPPGGDSSLRSAVLAAAAVGAIAGVSAAAWYLYRQRSAPRLSASPAVLASLAGSARTVCALRALEHERPGSDRLFSDPLAAALAGPAALAKAREKGEKGDGGRIAVRTRFVDEAVARAVKDGCTQVVVLGSGMDTRAWRLEGKGAVELVVELDLPQVVADKRRALSSVRPPPALTLAKQRVSVGADLAAERGVEWSQRLEAAGLRRGEKTCWVAEGLLYYLPAVRAREVLYTAAALSGDGSSLVASLVNPAAVKRARDRGAGAKAHFQFGTQHPEGFLRETGWGGSQVVVRPGDTGAAFGRYPQPAGARGTDPATPETYFVTATRE